MVPGSPEPEAAEEDVPEPHEAAAELFDVGEEEDREAEDEELAAPPTGDQNQTERS